MRKYLSFAMLTLGLMLSPIMVQAVPEGEASNASGVNDTTATAQGLGALGDTPLVVDGWISTNNDNDIDFYSFTGTMNQFVALGINHGQGRGGLDDVDTGLALFTPDGRLIAHDDDTMGNDPLLASVRLPMTGTYYVVVTYYENEPNGLSDSNAEFVDLHLGGELIVGVAPDTTIESDNGSESGDYTLTIVDADVLVSVAHSAAGDGQAGLPFDPGKRRSQLYNGAPRAQIGVDGVTFNMADGQFELEAATFGPPRDANSLIYFSVDSGTTGADLDETGTELAQGNGQRAANVYSSMRDGSNDLAIEAWRMGYEPDENAVNMDALVMGTASERFYPVFEGDSIVEFVNDHTFPVYFTIDDNDFADSDADILVVNSPTDAPHVFKYAAEVGLDTSSQIDGLVMVVKDGVLGVAFSLERFNAFGLSGTAVDDEEDGCYEGTNVYFSPCDGTNVLLVSGEDLGFDCDGEIDALDMMFTPPPPPSSGTGIQGPQGPQGPSGFGSNGDDGLNCWDLNGNGREDEGEDVNGDGEFDALDCQGAQGQLGEQGPQGAAGQDGAQGDPAPGQTVPDTSTTNPLCGTLSVATIPTMLIGLLAMGFVQRRRRKW